MNVVGSLVVVAVLFAISAHSHPLFALHLLLFRHDDEAYVLAYGDQAARGAAHEMLRSMRLRTKYTDISSSMRRALRLVLQLLTSARAAFVRCVQNNDGACIVTASAGAAALQVPEWR